ncbi:phosphatase PAP2 family protein [Colwellia sp. MSW7]|uniref:undecaprenyl-diphosphate phosphatase n=1 Tax=Colwellia maritima TaxID=2912588 RepID=A0ABS9X007_9GAMM|nr:phosphatase PAP2 family protein [Colwellia maritima]MCI2283581.1 phosphatase PAP2 family protein [Colwellia maritima]
MNIINSVYRHDCRLLLWCVKSHSYRRFIFWIKWLSRSGDGYIQLLIPAYFLYSDGQAGRDFFIVVLTAFAFERSLYFSIKNSLKRPRPPAVIPYFLAMVTPADQFSFPSGHTMASFLLATLVLAYVGSDAYPVAIWAAGVGVSRVVLGVHFPTDILAGASLGTSIGYGASLWL